MSKQMQELFLRRTTRVKSIAFHPNLPTVVTGNHCGTIYTWNYHYGQPISTLHEHVGSVRAVRFHPSGDLFASGGDDKVVRLWNYKTQEVVKEFRGHTDYIRSLDFHPTRPWLVSGSDDSTIKIWNYYSGEMLCSTSGHSHYIMSVLFLDSTHIATASLDHTICLWNCSNLFDQNKKFMVPGVVQAQIIDAHERGVNTLFFKDGQLYSGADDKEIRVWNYSEESLVPLKTLYSQEGNVSSVYACEGLVAGAAEDGCVSIYDKDGKVTKMEIGPRCWAVAIKNGNIAIGTDDGLAMYRRNGPKVCGVSEGTIYYLADSNIVKSVIGKGFENGASIYRTDPKEAPLRIIPVDVSSDHLILQYSDRFEIIKNSRRIEGEAGQALIYDRSIIKLQGTVLYRDNEKVADGVKERIIGTGWGVFSVDGRRAVLCYGSSKPDGIVSTPYQIVDIKATKNNLFVIGHDKISVYDRDFAFMGQVDEKVEITGSCLYGIAGDEEEVFVYSTVRQLKYYYEGFGTLQSLNVHAVPLLMADGGENNGAEFYYLCWNGPSMIPVNTGELKFRRAVGTGEGILSVIESEHLPGLSPLKYLISMGKGSVALPYIKDSNSRFSLFLSANDFKSALDVCDTPQMYNELAVKAFENGSYDVAEQCFTCIGDCLSLFFLYLSTKQIEKMDELVGTDVDLMVKLVMEDRSLFDTLIEEGSMSGPSQVKVRLGEASMNKRMTESAAESEIREAYNNNKREDLQENAYFSVERGDSKDSSAVVQDIYTEKVEEREEEVSSDDISIVESDGIDDYNALYESADKDTNEAGKRLEEMSIRDKNVEASESDIEVEEHAPVNTHPSDYNDASEESATFSNRTSTMAVNDSEPRIHMFDPSLVSDKPVEDIDASMNEALSLTTEGKFLLAIDLFREIISAIALRVHGPEDWTDERRKAGVYLWGLCTEVERRKIKDPKRSIQLAVFFSSLPLDPKHAAMALNLAVTLCFKHGNFTTARKLAEKLPRSKAISKVLESEKTGDKYDVVRGELCFDTYTVESYCKTCPMCFVKSKNGDVCGACQIGLLE